MHKQNNQFDELLLQNDFLKKHYECLPYIGEKYEKTHLLLIGESHYVPENEVDYVSRADFYDISFNDLAEGEYRGWINTRNVFENRVNNKYNFKNFFSNPATEIAKIIYQTDDLSLEQKISAMHYYSFMNYFKRPSYDTGKTIKGLSETDYKYAYDISSYIIKVLNPRLIIFLSKKAYNAFCDSDQDRKIRAEYIVKYVSHPSCCWWNRKRKDGGCAKEDFYNYISKILNQ